VFAEPELKPPCLSRRSKQPNQPNLKQKLYLKRRASNLDVEVEAKLWHKKKARTRRAMMIRSLMDLSPKIQRKNRHRSLLQLKRARIRRLK